jgi:hypothetical protein
MCQQLTCHAQSTWSIAVNCPARVYCQRYLKDGADAHRWPRFSHILSPMRQGTRGSFRPPGRSGALRRTARDFQYELGPDRLFEPVAIPDCHHKRVRLGWVRTHAGPSANRAARRCPAKPGAEAIMRPSVAHPVFGPQACRPHRPAPGSPASRPGRDARRRA